MTRKQQLAVAALMAANCVAAASAGIDAGSRIRSARSLKCTYQSSSGTWVRMGHPTVEPDPDNGTAMFDDINIAKATLETQDPGPCTMRPSASSRARLGDQS
jgi:hypothetical protein